MRITLYRITRQFTANGISIVKGDVYTEVTSVFMPVGFVCARPVGGPPYVIIKCEKVD